MTWPDELNSAATRITTAGDDAIAMAAAAEAMRASTPNHTSVRWTSTKVSAASARLVASSHGLRRSQRRLIRLPISNSSSASDRSTISRRLGFITPPEMPSPNAATIAPTVA